MRPKAQQFAPYLPSFLLRYFGTNPTPPTQARGDRFPGVALFADVAGSTKICNELTRISRLQGPEEMYRIFNAYYEPLVTLLNKRGGDVVGFAGDAVLAIWPVAEGESLTPALRQATQASLEAQRDLNGLELAPGVRLTMRICIGVGELVTSLVGGRQKFWQLVASGPPLDQIRDAGSLARIGEVYLSREACEVLGDVELFDRQPGGGHFVRKLCDSPGFPEMRPAPDSCSEQGISHS